MLRANKQSNIPAIDFWRLASALSSAHWLIPTVTIPSRSRRSRPTPSLGGGMGPAAGYTSARILLEDCRHAASQPLASFGGGATGALGGESAGKPHASRIARIASGFMIVARTRIFPKHRGQTRTSRS